MGKLQNVEAGRGIAALAVVVFHANAALKYVGLQPYPWLGAFEHGVDFFFVLSGFIIFHAHAEDIGSPQRAGSYALKRFIRIYPLVWMVAIPWMALRAAAGDPILPDTIFTSITLLPSEAPPVPLVLWTLRHEVLFYAMFMAMILNRKFGTILMGLWAAGCIVSVLMASMGMPLGGLSAFVFSAYHLDFTLGAGVAVLHRNYRFAPSVAPLIAGLALLLAILCVGQLFDIKRSGMLDYSSIPATGWVVVLGLAFAVVLHGLLRAEDVAKAPKWLVGLGSASFAIYLVHTPANAFIQRAAIWLPDITALPFIVAAGTACGVILHRFAEKPLTERLRSLLLGPYPLSQTR